MSDATTETAPAPGPRYFGKEGEGVQVVYNLRDASPYAELGYEEVDEAAYLASLPDPTASPFPAPSDGK
ncbi:hypothetical protein [Streptomyces sp. Root369]|uniref:hypothetical protein n=1 Tax=Streptomyces sp. Root369 TaxID=1736523 RepID=UPI000708EB73|nr:hypothetical protein [Streptomyces sp. Root369]KQW11453.1 hypothetical protein ASD08_35725 [Streptomyces sp. Root369]